MIARDIDFTVELNNFGFTQPSSGQFLNRGGIDSLRQGLL